MGKPTENISPKKVVISISLLRASGRDIMSGVFRYLETSSDWTLRLMQPEENPLTPDKLRAAEEENAAGVFITKQESPELMDMLANTPLPVAVIGFTTPLLKSRKGKTAFILNDNASIGSMGADYFLNLGKFNSFGFVLTYDEAYWMEERANGFRTRIAASLPDAIVETFPASSAIGSDEDIAALAKWIAALPKPAAVMAGADWRAVQVMAACEQAHVNVPDAVALLGVDNDEFLCTHQSPPLSSILPGHVEMGRRAAEELERMIDGKGRGRRKLMSVPPKTVVERESTHQRTPSAMLVDRAKRFISANASQGIRVKDVVDHLKVSQTLAELRYRAATGETIREAIESVRMDKLKRLLASTRRPIAVIAAECGFRNANSLSHRFRNKFGVSLREFRATTRGTTMESL